MFIKKEIDNLTFAELQQEVERLELPKYRAKQIFSAIHKNAVNSFDEITSLSKDLRAKLDQEFKFTDLTVATKQISKISNTKNYLFKLEDGNLFDSVFMEYSDRNSICISSQVGCRMGCVFCASTKGGRARNITAGEMVRQIYKVEESEGKYINNIVVMGQGEPLDNYDNLIRFLKIISDPNGANKSLRKITVSTCGLTDRIYDLANEDLPVTLALSLHRTTDDDRSKLMPINKKYPLEDVMKSIKYYYDKTGRRPSFEYMVIGGENDRYLDIKNIKRFVNMTGAHVNILELNPIDEYNNKGKKGAARLFTEKLIENNINATFRNSMGQDIDGACGQLRRKFKEEEWNVILFKNWDR